MPKASKTTPASSGDRGPGAVEDSVFEDFLAELSARFSLTVPEDIERDLKRWLDRLAEQLGSEQCTVGEFHEPAKQLETSWHWLVGRQPLPLISPEDSWIQNRLTAGQVTSISNLGEIPAEASSTSNSLNELGVRSGLWVPMQIEGSVIGALGLTTISHERAWTEQDIQRCRLVADVIGNALVRRRKAADVIERTNFETLITDISARFMNAGTETDALTDSVLSEVGECLEADRIGYLEVDVEQNTLMPTRQWIAPGIRDAQRALSVNFSARFSWLAKKIMRDEPVTIHRLEEFPDEAQNEKQYCESLGIQSFTMVPAELGGRVAAALALDNIRSSQILGDRIVNRLSVLAAIIASAKHREKTRRELDNAHKFERALSSVSTEFVNLPPEAVDDQIEKALGVVAGSLGADLITLLQPHGKNDFYVTHEWSTENFKEIAFKGTKVAETFPWIAEQLRQNKTVAVPRLSEFPDVARKEREAMEQAGHESVLFVPFEVRGHLAGYIVIDRAEPTVWPEELVARLRLLGEVFGEALNRREAELGLQESFKEINALKEQLLQENLYLRREVKLTRQNDEIVGDSAAMRVALEKVQQVAETDSTVLILGETGTGKELLARAIHNSSRRSENLMVTVNCASLPSSLVEAELFGREKGAYTGALSRELGRFEVADGSTIFLDEIGELPLELQAKLLRVLEEGAFERLGSSKTLKTNVRVLAATNRDLAKAVESKEFRDDLYYRLNVFPIELPPLRDRSEDIPQLVWTFVQEFSEGMGKTIESVPVAAMDALKAYRWPGNVREVRNIIERAMILSKGPILEVELPSDTPTPGGSALSSRQLADVEYEHIRAVVESTGWRIRGSGGAAEILGLKPTTLEARMKKLGLERSNKK